MALVVKKLPANAGDTGDAGSIPGLGRSPGRGHANPLQYYFLENPHGQRSLMVHRSQRVRHDGRDLAHESLKIR